MITWDAAKKLAAIKVPLPPPMPDIIPVYYAYKGDNWTQFDDYKKARLCSNLIIPRCANQLERDTVRKCQELFNNETMNVWLDHLKKEYNMLIMYGIFDTVYHKAYEQGHSYGMDGVASQMDALNVFLMDDVLPKYTLYIKQCMFPQN
jgi:hypothetical protein